MTITYSPIGGVDLVAAAASFSTKMNALANLSVLDNIGAYADLPSLEAASVAESGLKQMQDTFIIGGNLYLVVASGAANSVAVTGWSSNALLELADFSDVTAVQTALTALTSTVTGQGSTLTTLGSTVSSQGSSLSSLSSTVSSQGSAATSLSSTVSSLSSTVSGIASSQTTDESNIAALQTAVTGLNTAVYNLVG